MPLDYVQNLIETYQQPAGEFLVIQTRRSGAGVCQCAYRHGKAEGPLVGHQPRLVSVTEGTETWFLHIWDVTDERQIQVVWLLLVKRSFEDRSIFISNFLKKILLKLTNEWSTSRKFVSCVGGNIWFGPGVEGFTTHWSTWRRGVIYLQCLCIVVSTWTKESKHLQWKDTSTSTSCRWCQDDRL